LESFLQKTATIVVDDGDDDHHRHNIDKLQVRYTDSGGSGGPLLLIHGLGGSIESWIYNIDDLAKKGLRVIALDMPGFGFSDKPKIKYSVKFYVGFIAKFLKALNITKPIAVAGSSLGGHVACELAITRPDIVSKLILVSPSGALPRSFKGTPALRRYIRVLDARSVDAVKDALYAVDNKPVDDSYAKIVYQKISMQGAKHAFLSALYGSAKARRITVTRLSKIKGHSLVIWGKQDIMIPVKYAEPFVKMKSCRVVLLENCGHRPHADMPAVFNELVSNFVNEGKRNGNNSNNNNSSKKVKLSKKKSKSKSKSRGPLLLL
jgi:4,5:9,10-diseco-3-hydroxy-5,9,17-trioxoandrosta-1(10),2-diene-4-oate hydrolase